VTVALEHVLPVMVAEELAASADTVMLGAPVPVDVPWVAGRRVQGGHDPSSPGRLRTSLVGRESVVKAPDSSSRA
jgi:hypothetical protein